MFVETEFVGSLCVDNANFSIFATPLIENAGFFREPITQDQAISDCLNLDGASLGPLLAEDEYTAVQNFILEDEELFNFDRNSTVHSFTFYIGLEAENGQSPESGDPSVFSFVQNSFNANPQNLGFYHVNAGEFPWSIGEPNNFNLTNQNCALMSFFRGDEGDVKFDGTVDDVVCDQGRGFICRKSCGLEELENENDEVLYLAIFSFVGSAFFFTIFIVLVVLTRKNHVKLINLKREANKLENIY